MNFVILILRIFFIFLSFIIYKKLLKKCNSFYEIILFTYFFFVIIVIAVLYFIDYYNIPSYFGWNKNININEWRSFFLSFGGIILGEMFAGIILYFMTRMQINKTINAEREKNREEHRLNNMPLLIYEFDDISNNNLNFIETTVKSNTIPVDINLNIKNIGLNTVKKCFVKISSEIIRDNYDKYDVYQLYNQGCIEKNGTQKISFLMNLKTNSKYNFKFDIYYQDLMKNWYLQYINLEYNLTNNIKSNSSYLSNKKIIINDEILLDKEPAFKIKNN